MRDLETFLTEVYVVIDDLIRTDAPLPPAGPGPAPALSPSETLTLGLLSQWSRFGSERAFYRFAVRHLRPAFPTLPDRSQFNRQLRKLARVLAWLAVRLGQHHLTKRAYEVLDGTAIPVRNRKRRHQGWLAEHTDYGYSTQLGSYEGMQLVISVTPSGQITGYSLGSARQNERRLADALLARRAQPDPEHPEAGDASGAPYLADSGFSGKTVQARWRQDYGAKVLAQPLPQAHRRWSRRVRRWVAGKRQIVETAFHCLQHRFRLTADRPHTLDGLQARVAAKIALHNCCICLNRSHGHPDLAITELLPW
jgi:hypothetical protein